MGDCGTCKFWYQQKSLFAKSGPFGICRASKINHPKMRSGCGLQTVADFGCVVHEKKDE